MSAPQDAIIRIRSKDLSWREVDGEVIALDLVTSTYFSTNRAGTVLWHAMLDGTTVPALIAQLQSTFGITEDTATEDVAKFLRLLDSNGLLERP